jgi:hypothetical protein
MRIFAVMAGALLVGCGQDVDAGGDDDDPETEDTDTWVPPTTYPDPTGPNPDDPNGAETCALLYGGSDRVRGGDLWLPEHTEAREIQVWIRTEYSGEQAAFSYGRPSSQQGMQLGTSGGLPMIRAGEGDNQKVLGATPINDDEWHHLVATWDGNLVALVVDGEVDGLGLLEADTVEGDAIAGNAPTGDLTLPWIGWVDDVKVFAGHREPTDIAADPDGALRPPDDLKLWWDFEVGEDLKGPGVIVPDLSGYGHDGESIGTTETPEFPPCR